MSVNEFIQAVYVLHHILGHYGVLWTQISCNWGFVFSCFTVSPCLVLRVQGSSLLQWIFLSPVLHVCVCFWTQTFVHVFCMHFTIISIIIIIILITCRHTHVSVGLADMANFNKNKYIPPILICSITAYIFHVTFPMYHIHP